jgi:DNA mismatch repair protein MutS2
MAAEPVIGQARDEALARTRELAAGDRVRIRGSKTSGVVVSLDHDSAWLEVSGKRMRVGRSELQQVAGGDPAPVKAPASFSAAPKPEAAAGPAREVNLIGQRIEDAIPQIEKSLDEALLSGTAHIRIVHGHGTGRLRDAVREHLRAHPAVASLRAGEAREGGNGVTVVDLR